MEILKMPKQEQHPNNSRKEKHRRITTHIQKLKCYKMREVIFKGKKGQFPELKFLNFQDYSCSFAGKYISLKNKLFFVFMKVL